MVIASIYKKNTKNLLLSNKKLIFAEESRTIIKLMNDETLLVNIGCCNVFC